LHKEHQVIGKLIRAIKGDGRTGWKLWESQAEYTRRQLQLREQQAIEQERALRRRYPLMGLYIEMEISFLNAPHPFYAHLIRQELRRLGADLESPEGKQRLGMAGKVENSYLKIEFRLERRWIGTFDRSLVGLGSSSQAYTDFWQFLDDRLKEERELREAETFMMERLLQERRRRERAEMVLAEYGIPVPTDGHPLAQARAEIESECRS
jgi:hypothetical protein